MNTPILPQEGDPDTYVFAFFNDATVNGLRHAGKSDKEIIGQLAKEKRQLLDKLIEISMRLDQSIVFITTSRSGDESL